MYSGESNVNPQQDATSDVSISGVEDGNGNLYKYRVRDIATETELLKFRYVDNSKKIDMTMIQTIMFGISMNFMIEIIVLIVA